MGTTATPGFTTSNLRALHAIKHTGAITAAGGRIASQPLGASVGVG